MGGVGGGFLIIPFVYWIYNCSIQETINRTYILVIGGSIGNLI
jgi:lipoprotein signal peptidase